MPMFVSCNTLIVRLYNTLKQSIQIATCYIEISTLFLSIHRRRLSGFLTKFLVSELVEAQDHDIKRKVKTTQGGLANILY
jgi:hypothetical protein